MTTSKNYQILKNINDLDKLLMLYTLIGYIRPILLTGTANCIKELSEKGFRITKDFDTIYYKGYIIEVALNYSDNNYNISIFRRNKIYALL